MRKTLNPSIPRKTTTTGKVGQAALLLALLAGCATSRPPLDRQLLSGNRPEQPRRNGAPAYAVGCPDVLDLLIDGRRDLSGRKPIATDGRIDLGAAGWLRVEGQSRDTISLRVADRLRVLPAAVHVRVAEYNSQQVYLIGQVVGLQRAVAYQGPETVLDLLRRAGGLTAGAATEDVKVVRAHVADGQAPEVFHVNLHAILLAHDDNTNIYIQPLDEVFVGETRQFSLVKCFPPWLRPAWETICGMRGSK
jgi:protein involved in polysaccharide export with SLBB domain